MTDHILVPVDGSERSLDAFEYAAELFDSQFTVLYVVDPAVGDYHLDDETGEPVEQSEEIRSQVDEHLDAVDGVDPEDVDIVAESGKPAQTIIDYAEQSNVDHVVIGSRGRSGVRRLLLGSVAETVLRRSTVPVTVVRENGVLSE